jgi:hypothetical protein
MEVDRREEKGCVIEAVYMIKVHYMHLWMGHNKTSYSGQLI